MRFISQLLTGLICLNTAYAAETLDLRIPVVDMRDFYDEQKQDQFFDTLYEAMTKVGFFAVRNTGVDNEVIREAYSQAQSFFKKDMDYKASCYLRESKGQRGFVPGETAKGNSLKDCKEFYHIGRENHFPSNVWPDQPGYKEAMVSLYRELDRYVVPLEEAIIKTINSRLTDQKIPLDHLSRTTETGDSLLRALYYPALSEETLTQPVQWASAHTDIDYLAILPFATEKGLQVELDGQWHTVIVPDDAFIVNVGDMLRNMTNGLLVSARHRVMALEPNKERFSMVFFVHPTGETPLDPLPQCFELTGGVQTYAPGTRDEFLWERLIELNIAPGLLELYSKTGHTERQLRYNRESKQVVDLLVKQGLASEELLNSLNK